ncbi:FeoA family protein [Burkholderia glumae]|uniref:FeoA family protein n=1 Tax=Burkholderia glumae TaxID=337 RepID=UPI00203726EC|nr:FeoA family protein [Burkholderia glumae]MCM2550338.1 ferrous iron transport protein A [Burkholderia glumae]
MIDSQRRGASRQYNENDCYSYIFPAMLLSHLPKNVPALVVDVANVSQPDPIAQRLRDLGFVAGERLRVVAHGPWRADPVLIQIGSTRFALRRTEAARVTVTEAPSS